MAKKRSTKSTTTTSGGNGEITIDADRLVAAKEAESMVDTARLSHEEAKAKHTMARAEHKLWIAKRNVRISKTEDPAEVQDLQREVTNARNREMKAKSVRDAARDELRGAEERLGKTLTESLPLFDK